MTSEQQNKTNYTQGYSKATVASHAARTVKSDAGFLLPHIKATDSVLDVGCGPGTITVGFAAHLQPDGTVIGIDISDEILHQARRQQTSNNNLTFLKADLLAGLPFPDNTFDVVFSSQLFPHLGTGDMRLRALTEMRRVLKPGGILGTRDAVDLRFYPTGHDLDRLWAGNMVRALWEGAEDAALPGGDMPALYRLAGFEGSKVKVGAGTTVHAGPEARRWFADACRAKLEAGDPFRESWLRIGITDDEVEETRGALERWAVDDDAWYVALQAEVLGWK
ncbi:methyltransferase [Apodospora peruviana]|uniref:Methyltransferase n=1 Tax=Apodospora peruviana TaxID=516989 RepID=A0AAE0HUT0_9PEZI|nr:methyltransferase [Apodospora peruviana]